MTNDKIALRALLEKSSDASMLREMISFAVERLTALETETLCGAAPGERGADRINQRNGYRDRDWQTWAGTVELRIPKLRRGRSYEETNSGRRSARLFSPKPPQETEMFVAAHRSEAPSAVRVDLGA